MLISKAQFELRWLDLVGNAAEFMEGIWDEKVSVIVEYLFHKVAQSRTLSLIYSENQNVVLLSPLAGKMI